MDTIEKQSLARRTRQRNALTWLTFNSGGVLGPLASLETDLDTLASPAIENFMAISDEAWGIKEAQRDRTGELSQAEIDQDIALADAKVATGRAKLAIERAADEYVLAAKIYEARVKGLIMGAKEFAALMELLQLANEEAKAGLAVDKEVLRRAKVQADIYLETIHQAQVEADIAKAQVDVAKAHVRAAISGIEAGKAEIELIEAEIQKFMAEAEKATLQADVAMIWAEIMTKRLSSVKLGVGRAEITAEYAHIQSKLDDVLALYDSRGLIEEIKTEAERAMQDAIDATIALEVASEQLKVVEADYAAEVLSYEKAQSGVYIGMERTASAAVVAARNAVHNAHKALSVARDSSHTTAQRVVDAAHKATYKNQRRGISSIYGSFEQILKG